MSYTFSMDFVTSPPFGKLFWDLPTLHAMVLFTFLIQALVISLHARLVRRYRGIRMFQASALVLALSSLITVLRPWFPSVPLDLFSSALMLWGTALQYGSLSRFTGQTPSRILLMGLTGGGTALLLVLEFWPQVPFVAVREALMVPLLLAIANTLRRIDISPFRVGAVLTALPFVGYALLSVYRVVRGVISPNLMLPGPTTTNEVDALVLFGLSFLWTSGFLLMVNQRLQSELTDLAVRDPLTGCLNRRAMNEVLSQEIERFQRYQRPFTVILIDLDRFKSINDSRGHDVGDRVLVKTSSLLSQTLRAGDTLSRWGGEEFLLCLPETPEEEGAGLADRLRIVVAGHAFDLEGVKVTFSAGVAGARPDQSLDQLCRRADMALYKAKETRNRVMVAQAD